MRVFLLSISRTLNSIPRGSALPYVLVYKLHTFMLKTTFLSLLTWRLATYITGQTHTKVTEIIKTTLISSVLS